MRCTSMKPLPANLVEQPSQFKLPSLRAVQLQSAPFLLEVVEHGGNGYEPAPFLAQPDHEPAKSVVQNTARTKPETEVSVHDAESPLGFQPVLVLL